MTSRVLAVDDDKAIHELLRLHFAEEPIELLSAYTSEGALKLFIKCQPHLVLLDVDLPDLNGFDLCERLRADPVSMNIPVIFLTANSATSNKVCGLNLGATDYITKPFEPEELLARVRAALRMKDRMDFLASRRVREFMKVPLHGH
jgi:DNA-binding response OmpR family regulator